MGSVKDIMELFAERDLRQHFSSYDGWTVMPLADARPDAYFFRAARNRWACTEEAFIAATFSCETDEGVITALEALPGRNGAKATKYLLTPQAAGTILVPHHIHVLRMNAFAFEDDELVWLTKKKYAQPVSREPAAVNVPLTETA